MEQGYFICPNCGTKITDPLLEVCNNCFYDFGQLISCNYVEGRKCLLRDQLCKFEGMGYEDCEIFQQRFYEGKL